MGASQHAYMEAAVENVEQFVMIRGLVAGEDDACVMR